MLTDPANFDRIFKNERSVKIARLRELEREQKRREDAERRFRESNMHTMPAPAVHGVFPEFVSPADGETIIHSERQWAKHKAHHDVAEMGDEVPYDFAANNGAADTDRKFELTDAQLKTAIEKSRADLGMPPV